MPKHTHVSLMFGAALGAFATVAIAQTNTIVLTVGPGGQYQAISAAVSVADKDTNTGNYYDIQVMPGTYTNDFPYVSRPMTIEVHPCCVGQQVLLKATENLPNNKGIILTVASLTVDGLTFTGAKITNGLGGNGAGIRDQNTAPATLVVRNSTFIANQEGILTGDDFNETITITGSKFINNGNSNQRYFQHGLYVNNAASLTVQNSMFCGQLIGHDIKSRALVTMIENNQLYDGAVPSNNTGLGCNAGSTSLAIDLPNGGNATISTNQIFQGSATQNYKMVDYGEEGLYTNTTNALMVSKNTFTSTGVPNPIAIYDPNCVPVQLSSTPGQSNDNTFTGIAQSNWVNPAGCVAPPP